jgi:hypothetical protein
MGDLEPRTFASTALKLARDAAGDERGLNAEGATTLPTIFLGLLVPLYPAVEAGGAVGRPTLVREPPTMGVEHQFPNGIVSSVSFVSTTNTASSLAGLVLLALALTPWRSPGSSEKLCPALYVVTGPSLT